MARRQSTLLAMTNFTRLESASNKKAKKPFGANCQRAVQKSDVLSSTVESGNSRFISGLRYTRASQSSLLWRNPWMQTIFHQRFFSNNKSRRQELRISDEDKDELTDQDEVEDDSKYEVLDEQHISDTDDSEVLDEQQISDSEDDAVMDEEYVSDDDNGEESQYQVPAKKKFEVHAPKPKPVDEGPVLNEKITAKTLRLVDDEGKGHRVVLRDEALYLAKKKKMDLVMVDKKASPPVCKIFDFNRAKYQKEQTKKEQKKKKGAAAKLSEVKELRYSTKTELKDLKMKVDKAKVFLERGYKVKFVANFQAYIEEMPDRLEQGKMIHEVISMMDDIASIEQGPRFEARLVWVMFKHTKFGKPKKKAPKVAVQAIEDTLQTEADGKYEFASMKV